MLWFIFHCLPACWWRFSVIPRECNPPAITCNTAVWLVKQMSCIWASFRGGRNDSRTLAKLTQSTVRASRLSVSALSWYFSLFSAFLFFSPAHFPSLLLNHSILNPSVFFCLCPISVCLLLHLSSLHSFLLSVSLFSLSALFSLCVIIPASISSHQSTSSLHPCKLPPSSSSSPLLITPSHPPLPLFVARETTVHSVAVNLLTLSFYYLQVRCLIRRTKGGKRKSDSL